MIYVLVALWSASVILIMLNPKKASFRWLSGVSFCGGSGALAAVIGDRLLPMIRQQAEAGGLESVAYTIMAGASIVSYYGLPYTFLMFSASYHPIRLYARWKPYWRWGLLSPHVLMFLFTPVYPVEHPGLFKLLALWALPYVLAGVALMLTRKEMPMMRRNHLFTCLAVIPPVLFCSVMNYLLPSLGLYEMWRWNIGIILYAFGVFIFALFSYGFLGMQVYIRRKQSDSTMRAITSGTAILNHAIKNDVGKMKLFGEKIKTYARKTNQMELLEDIEVILRSSRHIQDMIDRVQDQTRELVLKPEPVWLPGIIEEAVGSIRPLCRKIEVVVRTDQVPDITGDRSHLSELIHNLLLNAVEAMPQGGKLEVGTFMDKNKVVAFVRDTGTGMDPKQLRQIMEPFYTTKADGRHNFGLGLSYCFNVVSRHRGKMHFDSTPGKGTTVYVQFPARKVAATDGTYTHSYR